MENIAILVVFGLIGFIVLIIVIALDQCDHIWLSTEDHPYSNHRVRQCSKCGVKEDF